ncbi:MAG TPA: DUF2280 domain-containing protein [Pyrinomonadaceae bacterium]|jgi:hypothetical protein
MPRLTKQQQAFIVQQLACFRSYSDVCADVKETFNLEIERQHVYHYDQSRKTNEKWKEIFDATRKAFLKEASEIGIAHQAYRLRKLQEIFDRQNSQARRNDVLLMDVLEHAAKEKGGVFTNNHKVDMKVSDDELLAKFLGCKPDELPDVI